MNNLVAVTSQFYSSRNIPADATVAVAFSGGADSMALLAATKAGGRNCVALHCNFHLRGEESNRDEAFARETARRFGCDIIVGDFDVEARCRATGESVEMACRSLRYEWFAERYRESKGAWACVAVAHHADDNVETMFLNLLRGTGLKGLCGIPAVRGIFVRPLLEVSRADTLDYLKSEGLEFVVDSTNMECDFKRNKLRNVLLPAIAEAFPDMSKTVGATIDNLQRDYALMQTLLDDVSMHYAGNDGSINLAELSRHPHAATLLFHLLNKLSAGTHYGYGTAMQMLQSVERSGGVFYPEKGTGAYLLNRGALVPLDANGAARCTVFWDVVKDELDFYPVSIAHEENGSLPLRMNVEIVGINDFNPQRNADVVWFDAEKIPDDGTFGLRRWRKGDRLSPFGMRGTKLVSDIFSDAKIPVSEKACIWLLVGAGKVLWVPGMRASRHFAVTKSTRKVLKISLG